MKNTRIDAKKIIEIGQKSFNSGDLDKYTEALRLCGKFIGYLARSGEVNAALALEPIWYNSLVKKIEKENHYHSAFSWHKNDFWQAGRACIHEPYHKKHSMIRVSGRIAFILHTGSLLGHTEVMLKILTDWKNSGSPLEPHVISLNGMSKELGYRLHSIKIPFAAAAEGLNPVEKVDWAEKILAKNNIGVAIWVSTPCWVSYIFGRTIAVVQILWSLKFHPVHLGPSVYHISQRGAKNGEHSVIINGDAWISCTPPYQTRTPRIISRKEIDDERKKYPDDYILIGSIAREEILNQKEYIEAVIRILRENPRSFFLYTGMRRPEILSREIERNQYDERAVYIGWVDVDVYAEVLDLYLDPFPFGSGVVCGKMLSSGLKIVSVWHTTTLPAQFGPMPWNFKDMFKNWTVVETAEEYIDCAKNLITAKNFSRDGSARERLSAVEAGRSERFERILTQLIS